MMKTLDQFIEVNSKSLFPRSEYVQHFGFESLYVRYGRKAMPNGVLNNVLTIANVTANRPGQGAFSELVKYLQKQYPALNIYVELVHNERFLNKLLRMGFKLDKQHPGAPSLYLLAVS